MSDALNAALAAVENMGDAARPNAAPQKSAELNRWALSVLEGLVREVNALTRGERNSVHALMVAAQEGQMVLERSQAIIQ